MTANPLRKAAESPRKRSQQEICNDWNAARQRNDVHWYVHEGQIKIGWERQLGKPEPKSTGHVMERDRDTFSAHDWRELSAYLESKGSPVRYRDDGTRFTVSA